MADKPPHRSDLDPDPDPGPEPWWIYRGTGQEAPNGDPVPMVLEHLRADQAPDWRQFKPQSKQQRGAKFEPDRETIQRVNAALLLRRPLLVTGPPGSGKTSLTYAIAYELGLGEVLRWSITSRTTLQDGLYHYDAIARLQDTPQHGSHRDERPAIGNYLKLGPLGTAFFGREMDGQRCPRVLLIDEIDKSDIDLPNDLLHIFEEGELEIPELKRDRETAHLIDPWDGGNKVRVEKGLVHCEAFPIVVMTSNGEREFPPAFLRRCLQLELGRPSKDKLRRIVYARLGPDAALRDKVEDLLTCFWERAKEGDLAADQLLNAVFLVMQRVDLLEGAKPLADKEQLVKALLASLDEHRP
jgi:MoxR-like ATPase